MSSRQYSESSPESTSQTRLAKIADVLCQLIHLSALVFCWCGGLLIAAILFNVIMRYGFGQGLIIFEEIQWHLYAVGMMFGLSYAEITNSQVRVEVVSDHLRRQTMRKWEIFGALFFIYPFIYVVMINGFEYVSDSYRVSESSNSPLGLPYRWAIKSVIPISFTLLAIAVTSRLLRNIDALITKSDGDR